MKIELDNDLLKTNEDYEIRLLSGKEFLQLIILTFLSGVDQQSCINFAKFSQDEKTKRSFLSIPYGDCGMTVTSSKRADDSPTITFEQIVRFDTLDIREGLTKFFDISIKLNLLS